MNGPVFVVVGHPNKGKSSIVATLAHDDSVRIAPEPGTTTQARAFPMRVDGEVLYTLVDTPGFQRARRALEWMRAHETTAAEHAAVVRAFVAAHRGDRLFSDECELLTPVIDGGGILYVVDGSVPYGVEYEPEMEILRWTGQPSMALVNPIGDVAHVPEWERALGQYFRIVRVFDAHVAEFGKRLELLRAFGELREDWRPAMDRAVEVLRRDRERRRRRSAEAIAGMLTSMLTLTVGRNLTAHEDAEAHKPALQRQFEERLRELEREGRRAVEKIYDLRDLDRVENSDALATDLFSEESWRLFGQSRWRLTAAGAAGGAMGGLFMDASLAGVSFGVFTGLGAAAGAALGWQAAEWSSRFQIFTLPGMEQLGRAGRRLQCGPARNPNLPMVALGRARLHHALVASRTHARRDALVVDHDRIGALNPLSDEQLRHFARIFTRMRRAEGQPGQALREQDDLRDALLALLEPGTPVRA